MESRVSLELEGTLQGVGFRPMIHRLATGLGLSGEVRNTPSGVKIEIEGESKALENFQNRMKTELPPHAAIRTLKRRELAPLHTPGFVIAASEESALGRTEILPDLATCEACLLEIRDPANRRKAYAFTCCTQCGPRYSVLEGLPYDRANTTLRDFEMCPACRAEYLSPADRRFHAQANCCPDCGPSLELRLSDRSLLAKGEDVISACAEKLRAGSILAIQGVGGFHLVCDAREEETVARLRRLKHRPSKPFAVLMPNLELIREHCLISENEAQALASPEAPIVLLERRTDAEQCLAISVAPGLRTLGVMLPYSPFYHVLQHEFRFPLVVTSGNLQGESLCTEAEEAFSKLDKMADAFVVHNRRIASGIDDSVVREISGTTVVFRSGRGLAPSFIPDPSRENTPALLAVGAHVKVAPAFFLNRQIRLTPHLGDLGGEAVFGKYRRRLQKIKAGFDGAPFRVACDQHPEYASSRLARELDSSPIAVQHHHAHILSCMAEHGLEGSVLGVAWDGTGLGTDGTLWGGEFLRVIPGGFERFGHLKTFCLPGGEKAAKEPRRAAAGVLFEANGTAAGQTQWPHGFDDAAKRIVLSLLEKGLQSPRTSSAGRLFDAVASLLGICQISDYEGQAATLLESLAAPDETGAYPFAVSTTTPFVIDWSPLLHALLHDRDRGESASVIAARFHRSLARSIVDLALRAEEDRVVLSGGCFQNKLLTETTIRLLRAEGFQVYWNQKVPPNDGGIAVGQIRGGRDVLVCAR